MSFMMSYNNRSHTTNNGVVKQSSKGVPILLFWHNIAISYDVIYIYSITSLLYFTYYSNLPYQLFVVI